jgi:hypothetical protein
MTLHLPRVPFSLDPLIAEARRRARRRSLLAAAVVAVGGAIAGTFALDSSNQPRPLVGAPTCRSTQLQLAGERGGVAAGTVMRDFTLTNLSGQSCTLRGWPVVRLVLRNGRTISPRLRLAHYYSSGVPNHALSPRTIGLRSGATASFIVFDQDWNYKTNQGCALVRTMLVTPPGGHAPLSVPKGLGTYCSPLDIGPIVPGQLAKFP